MCGRDVNVESTKVLSTKGGVAVQIWNSPAQDPV